MKRVRTIFGILKYELNQIFFSHKFIIVFLMSFMFMDFYIRDLRQMADDYNIGIFPAVNIFYFSDITYSKNNQYTSMLLLNAVQDALEKASPT